MHYKSVDEQYNNLILKIHNEGLWDRGEDVRTVWADGTPAYSKSIVGQQMRFDNSFVPILTSKEVKWKSAILEILWIWQMKSNNINHLNSGVWNQWADSDGSIGKGYGFQLSKNNREYSKHKLNWDMLNRNKNDFDNHDFHVVLDQVDYLIQELINNPSSRRHVVTLWNPDDLDEMALPPCVYESQWYVRDNKLTLEVRSRSNDMGLGNVFNVFQYNVLQRMIAQVTGYELGEFIYNIGDCHYYDRHEESLLEQIERPSYDPPKIWINPEIKNFYDFTIDDIKLINYQHGDFIRMEVAI